MAWYGWICFGALPFLVWAWLKERKEAAITDGIMQLPWDKYTKGG